MSLTNLHSSSFFFDIACFALLWSSSLIDRYDLYVIWADTIATHKVLVDNDAIDDDIGFVLVPAVLEPGEGVEDLFESCTSDIKLSDESVGLHSRQDFKELRQRDVGLLAGKERADGVDFEVRFDHVGVVNCLLALKVGRG